MDRKSKPMHKVLTVTSKDCTFQTFSVGGPGGGGKDTGNSGVRWMHPPSGAVGEGREERRQDANKRKAWERLGKHPKMVKWLKAQAALKSYMPQEVDTDEVYRKVDKQIEDGLKNGLIVVEEY